MATLDADELRFAHWVSHHERDSLHAPQQFRRSTVLLALLGYGVIWGTLLLGLAVLVWVLLRWADGQRVSGALIMLAVGAMSLVASVLRALWTPFPRPKGRRVTRQQAPALFKMLDKVQERTGGPRFDEVLINGELNAAVVQRPRLGLLGWYHNTLVLGAPLLFLLNPRQLAAVIAHEYGHLSGAHGKLGAWVYRTRRSWLRLAELRENAHRAGNVFDLALAFFFAQFFPRFNARAFVLSRQQEFEADAAAHDVSGREASSQALIAIHVADRYLSEVFWPAVFARARQGGDLRETPYQEMRSQLVQALGHPQALIWLQQAYKQLPSTTDTHPSLRQRLEFAECKPELPPLTDKPATKLLGKAMEVVLAAIDAQWKREHASEWAEAARWYSQRTSRLNALNEKREDASLNAAESAERAACIQALSGPVEALPVWQEAHRAFPLDDEIVHAYAQLLMRETDEASQHAVFALWTHLAASDSVHAVNAIEQAILWLEHHDRHKDAPVWRQRLKDRLSREHEAHEEQMDFSNKPYFMTTELSRAQIQDCLDALIRERAVGAAYLVRKQTRVFPQRPFYVLLIERSRAARQPSSEHYWLRLKDKLSLPGEFMVIDSAHPYWKDKDMQPVLQAIKKVPHARIYARTALGGR